MIRHARRLTAVFVMLIMSVAPSAAAVQQIDDQQPRSGQAPSAPASPRQPGEKTPPPPPPPAPPPAREGDRDIPGQLVNVRVELTITDQRGKEQPISKTVTMMVSDRSWGKIRTGGVVRVGGGQYPIELNVDARPVVARDDRVHLYLTIEYQPQVAVSETEAKTPTKINESIGVVLKSGESATISRSADPYTDRAVVVEAKATIVR